MRIAVDTMGGDYSPTTPIEGALRALKAHPELEVVFTGPSTVIREQLREFPESEKLSTRIEVVDADEVILPADPPVQTFRSKKRSSMRKALNLVRTGQAQSAVSTGSTGALMAGGLLTLGRVKGVTRPAIATVLPTFAGGEFLMLDLGAHMEADERNLVQYAIMGSLYARHVLNIETPRVGLLNVGEEPGKGRRVDKEAYELIAELPVNFVGNIESRVLLANRADVVVCDGFVGNIVLKVIEAVGLSMFGLLRRELKRELRSQVGALLAKPAFRRVYREVDYQEYGGAQLLGLSRPVVKCHGSAEGRAVQAGIETAMQLDLHDIPKLIEAKIAQHEEGGGH